MEKNFPRLIVLFTLAGLVSGFALAALVLPGGVPAQVSGLVQAAAENQAALQSTPTASGTTLSPAAQSANRSFTYQGMLRESGQPVNGSCDFQLTPWDGPTGGALLGNTQTIANTTLANGQFVLTVNDTGNFMPAAFDGRAVWLEASVRCPAGSGSYTLLSPRQAITAAPIASGLVPYTTLRAENTYSGNSTLSVQAPTGLSSNPMALQSSAGNHSNFVSISMPVGIWGDSSSGVGLWATTDSGMGVWATTINGSAIQADVTGSGWAGVFNGDVSITGKLNLPRFKVIRVINSVGGLPITSGQFSTSGGTLVIFYSGSGYSSTINTWIGMNVSLDGNFVDNAPIFSNPSGVHLAFVAKQVVVTGIAAGNHNITLTPYGTTSTNSDDIFSVTVMEMPY